jgi:MFS family permease
MARAMAPLTLERSASRRKFRCANRPEPIRQMDDHTLVQPTFSAVMNSDNVAHAIQLALAPVFLLTGIGAILNVLAARLARIIDRGRELTEGPIAHAAQHEALVLAELASLECRRHLASSAITAITLAALLVCTVIAALFLEVLLQIALSWLLSALFMCATLALVAGLALFLREVHHATRTVRISVPRRGSQAQGNEATRRSKARAGGRNAQGPRPEGADANGGRSQWMR